MSSPIAVDDGGQADFMSTLHPDLLASMPSMSSPSPSPTAASSGPKPRMNRRPSIGTVMWSGARLQARNRSMLHRFRQHKSFASKIFGRSIDHSMFDRRKEEESQASCYVHPSSVFRRVWDMLTMSMSCALLLMVPFWLAFGAVDVPHEWPSRFAFTAALVAVFVLDLGVNAATAYREKETGIFVGDLRKLAPRYLRSRAFAFDACCLAVDAAALAMPARAWPLFLQLLRGYRVARPSRAGGGSHLGHGPSTFIFCREHFFRSNPHFC